MNGFNTVPVPFCPHSQPANDSQEVLLLASMSEAFSVGVFVLYNLRLCYVHFESVLTIFMHLHKYKMKANQLLNSFAFITAVTMVSNLSSNFQGQSKNEHTARNFFFFLLKE